MFKKSSLLTRSPARRDAFSQAKPQRVKGGGVSFGYVVGLNDARTMLIGFSAFCYEFL
jgi:hypothetical protein